MVGYNHVCTRLHIWLCVLFMVIPKGCAICKGLEKRIARIEQQLEQAKYDDFTCYNEHMSAREVILCWLGKYGIVTVDSITRVIGSNFNSGTIKNALFVMNKSQIIRRIQKGEYVLN